MKTLFANDLANPHKQAWLRMINSMNPAEIVLEHLRATGKSILCKEFGYTPSAHGSHILNEYRDQLIRARAV